MIAPDIWSQTLDSGFVDLTNPRPEQIDFHTVARVLARIPRFGGHTEAGMYSVAQHSREGAYAILRDTWDALSAAAFLIHDAHEYIIGDICTPVRDALCAVSESPSAVRNAFQFLKDRLDAAIYDAAGLPWPLSADVASVVHEYDLRMMHTERLARLAPSPFPWSGETKTVAGVDTSPWSENEAAERFTAAMLDLC